MNSPKFTISMERDQWLRAVDSSVYTTFISENLAKRGMVQFNIKYSLVRYEAQAYDANVMISFEKKRLCADEESEVVFNNAYDPEIRIG